MKGWRKNSRIDFDFDNAHELFPMTSRARSEAYIKAKLRKRLSESRIALILIGESTRYLYKYVRWEIEAALDLGLPIIAVNLNGNRRLDINLCPPLLRGQGAVHISFQMGIIRHAISQAKGKNGKQAGDYHYTTAAYRQLGLK